MFGKLRTEADEKLQAIEKALNAEEKKLRKLEDARDDESWAGVVEAGEIPNYKIGKETG